MIKINIEYICDECGKSKQEKTIVVPGCVDVNYAIEDRRSNYMPRGWQTEVSNRGSKLHCPACCKKIAKKEAKISGDFYTAAYAGG